MPRIEIYLSEQSKKMLETLSSRGIYGTSTEEVVMRFVDKELIQLTKDGVIEIPLNTTKGF